MLTSRTMESGDDITSRFNSHVCALALVIVIGHDTSQTLSGLKVLDSENCCGSENWVPPKFIWDMEGHRSTFR